MARIRSIKPEYWRSDAIARLPLRARLTFIALWSYVDDNGVGRDNERLIAAEIYPLEDDPREALAMVREDLATLSRESRIIRYTASGKGFLYVRNWDEHQKIDRPGKPRYPRPDEEDVTLLTCDDADPRESLARDSRDPREGLAAGAGSREQGAGSREQGSGHRRRAASTLPDTWHPTDKHHDRARREGIDLARQEEMFRAHAKANDRRQVDWNAAFTQWLLNPLARRNGQRPTTPDTESERLAFDAWFASPAIVAQRPDDPEQYRAWCRAKRDEWRRRRAAS